MERVQKSRVNVIQKKEAAWPFLFLNNNDPVFFAPCFFQVHILDLIFFRVTNQPMFSKHQFRIVGVDWLEECLIPESQCLKLLKINVENMKVKV